MILMRELSLVTKLQNLQLKLTVQTLKMLKDNQCSNQRFPVQKVLFNC